MLEQNTPSSNSPSPSTFGHPPMPDGSIAGAFGFATIAMDGSASAAPLSVAAPRVTSTHPHTTPPNTTSTQVSPSSGPARLSDLVARAETLIAHLESRLIEEKLTNERASKSIADLDERLRIGVRMLQAFDVQVERGEGVATRVEATVRTADEGFRNNAQSAERAIHALADRLAQEKFEWLERELSWRFDRVKEVEERIEQAANGKLAWLDGELEARLGRIGESVARASDVLERTESAIARIERSNEMVDRAERATAALAGLTSESQRHIETLVARTSDAGALREALGTLVHEVSAAREVVQGELRRMRDDLGWLVEKGERIGGELVERADRAAVHADELRASTDAGAQIASELAVWKDLLAGTDRDRVRPIADAIASSVRDELAVDMRGFSNALRQLASRADGAFAAIRVDPNLLNQGQSPAAQPARELARSFAGEIARLGGTSNGATPEIETMPAAAGIAVNRPLELDARDSVMPHDSVEV
jgi:hypothetical protein